MFIVCVISSIIIIISIIIIGGLAAALRISTSRGTLQVHGHGRQGKKLASLSGPEMGKLKWVS